MRTTFALVTNILQVPQAAVNILSYLQLDKARISARINSSTCLLPDRHGQNCIIGVVSSTGRGGFYTLDVKV